MTFEEAMNLALPPTWAKIRRKSWVFKTDYVRIAESDGAELIWKLGEDGCEKPWAPALSDKEATNWEVLK